MTARSKSRGRRGSLALEAFVSLTVLAAAGAMVAELASWTLTERAMLDTRLAATDAADSVLERARATPFGELSAEWAAGQKLQESFTKRWPDARLTVHVEPEKDRRSVKRVTAEVKWTDPGRAKWKPIALAALFADRAVEGKK